MAYTLAEFTKLELEQEKCPRGHLLYDGDSDCEDCHFDDLGELVEKHPPGLPINPRLL